MVSFTTFKSTTCAPSFFLFLFARILSDPVAAAAAQVGSCTFLVTVILTPTPHSWIIVAVSLGLKDTVNEVLNAPDMVDYPVKGWHVPPIKHLPSGISPDYLIVGMFICNYVWLTRIQEQRIAFPSVDFKLLLDKQYKAWCFLKAKLSYSKPNNFTGPLGVFRLCPYPLNNKEYSMIA